MGYLLPDGVYKKLKWLGLIACPALAVFVGTICKAWGLPYADQIVITINALGAFIGALIRASQIKAMGGDE